MIFFRQILGYTDSPSISISALVSTVAWNFDMSTAIAEHEAETAAVSIRDSFLCVDNISGIGFFDSTGKSVTITDPNNHPRDVSYFIFRSSLNPSAIDDRAPNAVHQFKFTLILLHNSTTIIPLLSITFRYRALLLFPANHCCLHSMQPLAIYRILCWTRCQQLRCGIYFQHNMIHLSLRPLLQHCVLWTFPLPIPQPQQYPRLQLQKWIWSTTLLLSYRTPRFFG